MTDTVTVRVAQGRFWLDGEYRTPDDEPFDVREVVAETHPRTLERVAGEDADGGTGNPGEDSSAGEDDGLDPSEHTLTELESELEDTDVDADTLHERESEGDDRVGAHEMIDAIAEED